MDEEMRARYAAEFVRDLDALLAAERCGITESEALCYRMEAGFPEAVRRAAIRETLGRAAAEYEALAFADTSSGEVKAADKLRALGEYGRILREGAASDAPGGSAVPPLTVVYEYR